MVDDDGIVIYGPHGQPLPPTRPAAPDEVIARARITGVRNARNWHSVLDGLTPQRLAQVLRDASDANCPEDQAILAEEIEERNAFYRAVLTTRRLAVTRLPWVVEPADDSRRAAMVAETVEATLRRPEFAKVPRAAMDAVGKGYSLTEIVWRREAHRWQPRKYLHVHPRWVTFDYASGEVPLLIGPDGSESRRLPPQKFIWHAPMLKSGLPVRGGLVRPAAILTMLKSYSVRDWWAFGEVFGLPIRIGKYPPNATAAEIDTLKTAVANIASDAGAVIPASMLIELISGSSGGSTSGGEDVFVRRAAWCDEQTSILVLGQTMTTVDGSSRSQAEVHDRVRREIRDDDADQLAATINSDLVRVLTEMHFGIHAPMPTFRFVTKEPRDLVRFGKGLESLVRAGVPISKDWARREAGAEAPKNEMDRLQPAPAGTGAAAANAALNAALNAGAPGGGDTDYAELAAERLEADIAAAADAEMIEPIRELVFNARSYDEIEAGLKKMLGDLPAPRMQAIMGRAFAAANLAGRADAAEK